MTDKAEQAVVDGLGRFYRRNVDGIIDRLRRMADEIEREAAAEPRGTHVTQAARIEHTLRWGYANLHIDGLIEAAQQLDGVIRDAGAAQG